MSLSRRGRSSTPCDGGDETAVAIEGAGAGEAKSFRVLLTALLLMLVGLAYASKGISWVFRALGLDLDEVLVYFGLAEVVEPGLRPVG